MIKRLAIDILYLSRVGFLMICIVIVCVLIGFVLMGNGAVRLIEKIQKIVDAVEKWIDEKGDGITNG